MPGITIIFGALMIALGVGTYAATQTSLTALIPAAFGILFVLCGLIARKPSLRKHAMHAVAMLALIGTLSLGRVIPLILKGASVLQLGIAAQLIMGVLCLVLLVLCIRSFIQARRARTLAA